MLYEPIDWIANRYQILSLLGEGGMGSVYKAYDITLQRDVAVKVMHRHIASRAEFQDRFLKEARSAARLDHPCIVRVIDVGSQRFLWYLVMKFIPGDNLQKLLESLRLQSKWIPIQEAVLLVQQLALALDFAHQNGVLHRDIKPGNIMIEPSPYEGLPYRPVITDLGLAKLREGGMDTQEGFAIGTPAYMSPEHALGEDTDARSDVYSLGVLLYELVTGRVPFAARSLPEIIRYYIGEGHTPPSELVPGLSPELDEVMLTAIARKPGERYQSAASLAEKLSHLRLEDLPEERQPPSLGEVVSLITPYQTSLGGSPGEGQVFHTPPEHTRDLVQVLGPDKTTYSAVIPPGGMTMGRDPDCDLVLDDSQASRHQARVEFDGKDYRVIDLNSTNGTYLEDTRLLPGRREVWPPDRLLRIGDSWLRLLRVQREIKGVLVRSDGSWIEVNRIQTSAGDGRIGIFIENGKFSVEPGEKFEFFFFVVNLGNRADRFQISLEGVPNFWVVSPPSALPFKSGDQRELKIILQPPRTSKSRAGRYPIAIRVSSLDDPDQFVVARATLTVTAFSRFHIELLTPKISAGKPGRIKVENQGNTPDTFKIIWEGDGNRLTFQPAQIQLNVAEGRSAIAEYSAHLRRPNWLGSELVLPFTAQVTTSRGEPQSIRGEISSRALMPVWVLPLISVLILTIVSLIFVSSLTPPVVTTTPARSPSPGGFLAAETMTQQALLTQAYAATSNSRTATAVWMAAEGERHTTETVQAGQLETSTALAATWAAGTAAAEATQSLQSTETAGAAAAQTADASATISARQTADALTATQTYLENLNKIPTATAYSPPVFIPSRTPRPTRTPIPTVQSTPTFTLTPTNGTITPTYTPTGRSTDTSTPTPETPTATGYRPPSSTPTQEATFTPIAPSATEIPPTTPVDTPKATDIPPTPTEQPAPNTPTPVPQAPETIAPVDTPVP